MHWFHRLTLWTILTLTGISVPGCGGPCTYDTFTGQWVVTAITETPDRCCEDEQEVSFAFVEDGRTLDDAVWGYVNCIENERVSSEQIAVGTSYSDTVKRIDTGTCNPTISENFPSALEESEAICIS